MASPVVAGTAALLRQYFSDSRFWAASCNKLYLNCAAFTPSGVLIKTILIHSGSKMIQKHGISSNTALGNPPDFIQGYGRVALNTVLPLAGKYAMDLFVADLITIGENSAVKYFVTVTDSTKRLKY